MTSILGFAWAIRYFVLPVAVVVLSLCIGKAVVSLVEKKVWKV